MLVYYDIFTDDEVVSDSYPQCTPLDDDSLEDILLEVKTTRRTKGQEDYGITDNSDEGNGVDSAGVETVIDVVDAFSLSETSFGNKKEYTAFIKELMKKVKKRMEEQGSQDIDNFMGKCQIFVKKVLENFDDYQFFLSSSMDLEGGLIHAYYKGEEDAPRLLFLRQSIVEEKC